MRITAKVYIIITVSILISLGHYISQNIPFESLEYNLKEGQIAEKTIIAPFSFPVYKSQAQLESEMSVLSENVPPIYRVSEDIKFNVQKNLDVLFQELITSSFLDDKQAFVQSIKQRGYSLSEATILFLQDRAARQRVYDIFSTNLEKIMNIGIYSTDLEVKAIDVYNISGNLRRYNLQRLYSLAEVKENLKRQITLEAEKQVIDEISDAIIVENIVIDKQLTQQEQEKVVKGVNPVLKEVLKNEEIVRKNRRVSALDVAILKALTEQSKLLNQSELSLGKTILYILGLLIIYAVELFALDFVLSIHFKSIYFKTEQRFWIFGAVFVFILFNQLIVRVFSFSPLIVPFALFPILIGAVFSTGVGYIYAIFQAILMTQLLNWDFTTPLVFLIGTVVGLTSAKKSSFSRDNIPFLMLASFFAMNIAVSILKFTPLLGTLLNFFYILISIVLVFVGFYLFSPIVEKKLKLLSKRTLLNLLDYEHPLLKQLSTKAPGTYFHSLIVGNIAEKIAEAIGADPLIARVCSYYHDIGKINDPTIFSENNPYSSKHHDNMSVQESVKRIRKHIEDGAEILTFHKFPDIVLDAVYQHHGTNKMLFFEQKAKTFNLHQDADSFRYFGPKPQSKETAIVMMADIIESTVKSQKVHTDSKMEEAIESTISYLIKQKQFVSTPITLGDLAKVKDAVMPVLKGIYHTREEYPDDSGD